MAKTSFANPAGPSRASVAVEQPVQSAQPAVNVTATVIEEKPAPASTQVVPAAPQSTQLSNEVSAPAYSDSAADIGAGDITIPRINIVQKVGELSTLFPGGTILLAKEAIIYDPEVRNAKGDITKPASEPMQIVLIGFAPTYYTEKVQGGGMGRIFRTPAEVSAAGGTTIWAVWDAQRKAGQQTMYAEQTEEALLLVKRPKHYGDDVHHFPFTLSDGSAYAVARWSMKGTSYTHAAKHFLTARKFGALSDRNGKTYVDGVWDVRTELKQNNGNYYYQPIVNLLPTPPSAELREIALAVRG